MVNLDFTAQKPLFIKTALLRHGNIPKPLHQLTPRSILGAKWWDKERQEAYAANNYCCWTCGVHKSQAKYHQWLEAHETYSFNWEKGRAVYKGACALCHSCHNFIHCGRLRLLANKGEIPKSKYHDIMHHGEKLVGKVKNRVPQSNKIQRDWSKWHLILNGQKYYSSFEDLSHWENHFNLD